MINTHIVTDNCIKCKYTDCVSVCPVDCFYEGPNFLAINADECINCGVCVPVCPAQAIMRTNDNRPDVDLRFWFELNQRLSQKWPNINKQKDPLPDAADLDGKANKIDMLEE